MRINDDGIFRLSGMIENRLANFDRFALATISIT